MGLYINNQNCIYSGDMIAGDRLLSNEEQALYLHGYGYKIVDGIITDISQTPEYLAEQLQKAKTAKLAENEQKASDYKKNGAISTSIGDLKLTTPVGDIGYVTMALVVAQMDIPAGMLRLSDGNPAPALTKTQVQGLYAEILTSINNIDKHFADVRGQIEQAQTLEELEAVVIVYEV